MPTIREVAKACGVSPMTVSYVLNNPGRVQQETRSRVLQAMRDMNYRPISTDRDAKQERHPTIGVVYSRWNRLSTDVSYYSRIILGILDAADDRGCHVTLFSHHTWTNAKDNVHQSVRRYCDGRCEGLLVFAPKIGSRLLAVLRERGMPFVLVGDTGDEPEDACVDTDNIGAAEQVTNYLADLGHRRIAFLPGEDNTRATLDRTEGYRRAMTARGLPVPPEFVPPGDWLAESGYTRAKALLTLPEGERPTALFCITDAIATGALAALRELGLRVPEDVALAGFDDSPDAQNADPPLTSIHQAYTKIGLTAVDLLARIMDGEPGEKILLPGELVIRASTG